MADRALVANFVGYTGIDILKYMLPKSWQTRILARRYFKMYTTPDGVEPDLTKADIILQVPWGSYRVVNKKGDVVTCPREHVPGL